MPRYIDADLIQYRDSEWGEDDTARRRDIEQIPTADVAPVRHGEWKQGDMPTYGGWKCTACNECTTANKPRYCPNCGAQMR